MLSRYFLEFSMGIGAFVIGLSQISSFFLVSEVSYFKNRSIRRFIKNALFHSIPNLCIVLRVEFFDHT